MDYEKEYKKRLDDARYWHDVSEGDIPAVLEEIFPELRESEDERIRKNIKVALMSVEEELADFYSTHHTSQEEFLAWLEKQGNQKPYGQRVECLDCQFNYAGECKGSCAIKRSEQKSTDKIQLGKKYKCIASPRYSTFMVGQIYKPEDKFLCSLMNFYYDCFELIEEL